MTKLLKILSILMMPFCFPLNAEQFELAARRGSSSDYTQYLDEIITAFTKEMKAQFGLEGEGKKGQMSHDVEEISINLVAYQKGTIEQAREWEIKATERLVEMVNAHEKIRPFLKEYPFLPARAVVSIFFSDRRNSPYIDNNIALVTQTDYRINYYAKNPLNIFTYRPIKEEAYIDAFDIVQNHVSNDLSRDAVFLPLQGKIVNGRYYSPENIFSCQAEDYGQGEYFSQDDFTEGSVVVGFLSPISNFKKADIASMPHLKDKQFNEVGLKNIFEFLRIEILEKTEKAQGIKVLKQELLEGNTLFVGVSIDKMPALRHISGRYLPSARGYLIFLEDAKLVVVSNQEVTLPGVEHTPEKSIEKLKSEIVDFRKSFEFGHFPNL